MRSAFPTPHSATVRRSDYDSSRPSASRHASSLLKRTLLPLLSLESGTEASNPIENIWLRAGRPPPLFERQPGIRCP